MKMSDTAKLARKVGKDRCVSGTCEAGDLRGVRAVKSGVFRRVLEEAGVDVL